MKSISIKKSEAGRILGINFFRAGEKNSMNVPSFSRTSKVIMPTPGSFPRLAGGTRDMPGSLDPRMDGAKKNAVQPTRTARVSSNQENTSAPFGGFDDEKSAYKSSGRSEYKDQAKAVYSEECDSETVTTKETCEETKEGGSGWGYGLIWLIVLFIFIVIIIFGFFWFSKPDFVTQDCEDGDGREISPVYAGGFAFIIAFFFIVIIGVGWYAMSGRKSN
jgi:hypothetical protein